MEIGVVVATDGSVIAWHLPPGRSAVSLPDSTDLWTTMWESRHRLAGVAHSHPGGGRPGPSRTDVTTFAAVEAGLGRRLRWWITSTDGLVELEWRGPGPHDYGMRDSDPAGCGWLAELREMSYGPRTERGER